jgi:hypothetical protein
MQPSREEPLELVRALLNLSGEPREYEFAFDRRESPPILHIPGDHRGPDVCIPSRLEQKEWLDTLGRYMAPYWDCQWKLNSEEAFNGFVEYLRSADLA